MITLRDKVKALIEASGDKVTEEEALVLLGKTKADLNLNLPDDMDIFNFFHSQNNGGTNE